MANNDKRTYGSEMSRWERFKLYGEMTNLGEIVRRYFVMNFFDGVLTVLGIIIASFILFLEDQPPTKNVVIIQAIATSFAIGISGISGGYLSERAERKRNIIEMHKAMAEHIQNSSDRENSEQFKEEDYYPTTPIEEFEKKELMKPREDQGKQVPVDPESPPLMKIKNEIKEEKTLAEKAERYASWIASLINGVSPAVGGFAVVIPFFFENPNTSNDDLWVYISCFIFITLLLFFLGAYLAKISKDSIWKYGIKMTLVGILVAGITFLVNLNSLVNAP